MQKTVGGHSSYYHQIFVCRCLPSLLLTVRLPKWLYNPPVLTNLPLLPTLDLGTPCTAGGLEGICLTQAQCAGFGLTMAGHCTRGHSVCCAGRISHTMLRIKRIPSPAVSSCSSSLSSPTSYFTSPEQPPTGAACQASVLIPANTCYLR